MRASPVRKLPKPRYPTRLEIAADPELLRRHLPLTWTRSPELASAAALLLALSLPGYAAPPKPASKAGVAPGPANAVAIVAPLFKHGEGTGAFGCIVVNPPVFLTEDEAWRVIDAELAKRGIKLGEKEHPIPGIEIPLYANAELEQRKEGDPLPKPTSIEPLKADRADPQKKIVVEFVSAENPPEKSGSWTMGTVGGFDLKREADALRTQVAEHSTEKIFFGALYDPAASRPEFRQDIRSPKSGASQEEWNAYFDKVNAPAKAKAKRLLRQQVRDFIHWLEAQGAI